MDQAFKCYIRTHGASRLSTVVEDAKQQHADDCKLRLARIANGAHPDFKNGHLKDAEKGRRTK